MYEWYKGFVRKKTALVAMKNKTAASTNDVPQRKNIIVARGNKAFAAQ